MDERTGKRIQAVDMINDERRRQKTEEGWTNAHDDAHEYGELREAGECYLMSGLSGVAPDEPTRWPWPFVWWKPKGKKADLIRAGALFQAEIDRLERIISEVRKQKQMCVDELAGVL